MQEFYNCMPLSHTSYMKQKLDMHKTGLRNITHALRIGMLIIGGMICGLTSTSLEAATVSLSWDAPTNTDGTPVANLAGYRLYYGTASQAYSNVITVGLAQSATISNLQEGVIYYFSVVAYNDAGTEGSFSQELSWAAMNMSIAPASGGTRSPGFVLQWTSETNAYYTVMKSTNLMANPAFITLASHVPGVGSVTSYTDTSSTSIGASFYMVQAE